MQVVILLPFAFAEETRALYRASFAQNFPGVSVEIIDHHNKLTPLIGSTDVLMSYGKPLGPNADALMAQAHKLKWIQCLGTGTDNITDLPSLRPDVIVTSTHGIQGSTMSEAVLMAMLALSRELPQVIRNQDAHIWKRWPGKSIEGKTATIFGVGAIAEAIAPRLKAMGMIVTGITARRQVAGFDHLFPRADVLAAVSEADYLVLLVPHEPATKGIINRSVLAAMKPTSYLINVARGAVIDDDALIEALGEKRIAGAALDAFATEPLPADHPYWTLPNVIITPHAAGYTDAIDTNTIALISENLRRFLAGDTARLINIVERSATRDACHG